MTEAEHQNFLPGQTVNIHEDVDDENEVEQNFTDLKEDFLRYPLIQFMQYSNTLYRILHNLDLLRHRLAEYVATFGFGPREIGIYRSNYEHRTNWAYYVTRDILIQTTRPDIAHMTLTKFIALLVNVQETKIIRQAIHSNQDGILAEFEARSMVKIPAVLIYRRILGARSNLDTIGIFKRQLEMNNFLVEDIYDIEPSEHERELKKADAVFVVFDEEMNRIFDETLPFTPEPGDLDFRHIGRILYLDFLVNDCRNERIYLFLTPGMNAILHQSFKFPWLLRESNLNFANDQELINRPEANRVRTYKKPPVLPDDVGYVNNVDHEDRGSIDTLLGSLYMNHNKPNRNSR